MNLNSIRKFVGLIPGLARWVEDLAVVWVTVTARIPSGCGVGGRLRLRFDL